MECEVFDLITRVITHTAPEVSLISNDGLNVWKIGPSEYRVYGLTKSQMALSTQILTLRRSSSCTITIPPVIMVKIEPRSQCIIDLSQSKDAPPLIHPMPMSSSQTLCPASSPLSLDHLGPSHFVPHSSKHIPCILQSLQKLASMPKEKAF